MRARMVRILIVVVAAALVGCIQPSPTEDDHCPMIEPANQSSCSAELLACTYGRDYCQCEAFQAAPMSWVCATSSCPTDVGCAD